MCGVSAVSATGETTNILTSRCSGQAFSVFGFGIDTSRTSQFVALVVALMQHSWDGRHLLEGLDVPSSAIATVNVAVLVAGAWWTPMRVPE